jgi:protein subunit release factor A
MSSGGRVSMSGYEGIHTPNICRLSIKIMSNLSGLLHEHTQLQQRLDDSVISGDLDTNTKLERSKSELERTIFFEKTADYREKLKNLESERIAANDLRNDFQAELKAQAEKVMEARSKAFDEQETHNQLQARLYHLDNTIEVTRQTINELKAELAAHLKQKLYGGNDNGY